MEKKLEQPVSLQQLIMQQIEVCQKENRLGTAMNYRRALRRLDQFTGGARPAA